MRLFTLVETPSAITKTDSIDSDKGTTSVSSILKSCSMKVMMMVKRML